MMTPKLWTLLALAAAAVLAWVFRYETIPVVATGPVPSAYLVNRWTGTTYLVRGATISEVKPAPPTIDWSKAKRIGPPPSAQPRTSQRPDDIDRFLDAKPNPFDEFDSKADRDNQPP